MKYSIDKDNRLIIRQNGKNIPVNGFFEVDEANRLIYWLNEPVVWRKQYRFPAKIVFTGNWVLNNNYDLEMHLTEDKTNDNQEILTIKGKIISVAADKLVFEVKTFDTGGLFKLRLLQLSGTWQVDEYNQLTFKVSKKDMPDILTFQGAWTLNQNQQIVYSFEKTELKRRSKVISEVEFSGFWEVNQANRLTYILSTATNSRFDFRAQLESPNLFPKEGVIKYRLGAGLCKPNQSNVQIIELYGVWKFSRKLVLSFEMEYASGEFHSLYFGAEVRFGQNNQIEFNLLDRVGEKMGGSLIFTHKFLKELNADAFLRLKKLNTDFGVDVGVRIPF